MSFKRSFKKRRLWVIPIAIIVIPLLVVLVVGQFTPVLTAWLLKPLIGSATFTAPPNFKAIEENVVVKKDITYGEHGTLLDIYYPRHVDPPLPVIMWIHGGGFIGASKEQTQVYGMTLANAGYVVANINYDLSPAYKYPTPVIEANQALKYLRENISQYGGDINRLFLGSNSSGSQIDSQVAALISNQEFARTMGIQPSVRNEQLKGVLLYDGAYDMQTVRATHLPGLGLFLWSYTGVRHFESYDRIDELSTVNHITPDYPPVFLTVGDADPLEHQSLEFIQVLKRNGVEQEPVLFTGTGAHLGHDYMMDLDTGPAQRTLEKALDFLERHSRP
jgi:acetyl esterase/lipase